MPESAPTRHQQLNGLAFSDGAVHIWRGDLDRLFKNSAGLEGYLDSQEQQRAHQFAREQHRRRFIASRGILREILSRCVGAAPAELTIATTRHGKPYLPVYTDWHFNVSHSGNYALWSVAQGREVGVDIERIRPNLPLETLIPRVLSEREQRLLHQHQTEGEQTSFFLRIWTLKEAFLKANGCGLFVPLTEIDVLSDQISHWDSQSSDWHLSKEWSAGPLTTFPNCVSSIVAWGHNWSITQHEL